MECKKCPYFENKREITNTGKVVIGFCKLRSRHITDLTIKKEFCKDRASIDAPANTRVAIAKEEKSLFTPKETEQLAKARVSQKPTTFGEMAGKQEARQPIKFTKVEIAPEKITPKIAIELLEQQKKLVKPESKVDEDLIRRAVWGGK